MGIPDQLQEKLAKSGRAPNYKMIALAILKNDYSLKTLGLDVGISEYYIALRLLDNESKNMQMKLL